MAISKLDAMHQTREATNTLLTGYEMLRKEGNLKEAVFTHALVELHKKHSGELLEHLSALGYSTDGDSPDALVAEIIDVPDTISLATLTDGENALVDAYRDALAGWPKSDSPEIYALIENQYAELQQRLGMEVHGSGNPPKVTS